MDTKKIGTRLLLLGLLLVIVALGWWFWFYAPIAHRLDVSIGRASSCFYSNEGICAAATSIAQLTGKTPYSPVLAWIGALLAGVGAVLKIK
ncbi:MAG TPA: hypothetical protein VIF60_18495 [Burkholderiaceae bacterium]|jgi:hypothetical protein